MKFTSTFKNLLGLCLLLFTFTMQAESSTLDYLDGSYQMMDPPVIIGNTNACPGETVMYGVEMYDPANTYEWSLSGGGVILSQSNGMATVQWQNNAGGPFQLQVIETAPNMPPLTGFINVTLDGDVVLVCNDNLNISLANNCQVLITADMVLEGTILNEESYTIEVRDENGILINPLIGSAYINHTLEVTVIHNCSNNKCWGNVTIEDKVAPVIQCQDVTLSCDEFQNYIPTATLSQDNCNNATLSYSFIELPTNCDSEFFRIFQYTWTAVDFSGNQAIPCVNNVYVLRETLDEIELPINYDGLTGNFDPLSCSGNFPLNNNGYPDPSYTGFPGGDYLCANIQWTYTDIFIPLCDLNCGYTYNSYKIIRNWVIVDWCTGQILNHTQIIKVLDQEAPVITPMADITAYVNPFDCSAQITLPIPVATDNCTQANFLTHTYKTSVGYVQNGKLYITSPAKTMPGNPVIITVTVSDCCGNTSEDVFQVTIRDNTPPVVVADAHEIISLLPSGSATMYATSIDDGSYDNCGPLGFFAKRMDNGAPCPPTDIFPPAGNDNAQFNEVIHFCCADVNNGPIMVQFRVCDDADMNGIIGSALDNCNNAMVEVTVQDKYVPVLQCPPNMTVNCNDFYSIDIDDIDALNELFGEPFAQGTCAVEVQQTVGGSQDLECGEGVIIRTFIATTSGGTNTCTQVISIQPDDESFLTCDRISFEGLNNSVYNWCLVNDNNNDNDDDLPAIVINSCEGFDIAELNINTAGLCTTVGYQIEVDTFTYTGSVCKKYVVHYEVIDQCLFDENFVDPITGQIDPYNSANGYFEFYLEYNVMDDDAPVLDCTAFTMEGDTCGGSREPITIIANDACTPDEFLLYQWKIDLFNDGSIDYPGGFQWAIGRFVTPEIIGLNVIPEGTHKIYWRVGDGCGNVATCSQLVTITPYLKAPTPYCYNGISIAVMQMSGQVDIWATDFDAGSYDDCVGPLTFTMIPEIDAQASSNPYADSEPSWTFGCEYITNGVYEVLEIRMYVTDQFGAYDYCTTTLRLEDNAANACPDNIVEGEIAGSVAKESGDKLQDVYVSIDSDQAEYPMVHQTVDNGLYSFNANMFYDYSISAEKNDDYLNGVTTLDIVIIQKHILGLQNISNPYSKIAADANKDCKVTGADIVQLRKLILGKYPNNSLPNNGSWRFLTDENIFFDDVQPCDLIETISIDKLETNLENQDFTAVKIGDINNSATINFSGKNAETRSSEELILMVQDQQIEAGEYITIDISALNYQSVNGYQFTFDFDTEYLTYVNMFGRMQNVSADNVNDTYASTGQLMVSYADVVNQNLNVDEYLFSMVFEVKKNGSLRNLIDITSDQIRAESYIGDHLDIGNVRLQIRENDGQADSKFILYQNKPNPFNNSTTIGFELAKSGQAIITVYDVTGKKVYQKTDAYSKGYNEILVRKNELKTNGVLYIHLESNGNKAVKKMMLIE